MMNGNRLVSTTFALLAQVALLAPIVLPRDARAEAQDCTSNVLIVIDRSCSMTNKQIMGKTRWAIAKDAIASLLTTNAGKLRFGLAMFPDKATTKPMCVQTMPLLAPTANNEANVTKALNDNTPGAPCVTNIDEGVRQASLEPSIYDPARRSFIVLITDGAQSGCNGNAAGADPLTVQYITEMYSKKVPTYVVGFDVGSDAGAQASLNMFAAAGGLPNSGTNKFYPANNQQELEDALNKLASLSSGGEISLCRGMPCPDNRCLHEGASCVDGFCIEPTPDGGGNPNGDLGDDGTDRGGVVSGCNCQLGGRSSSTLLAPLSALILCGALALRRRRRAA